MTATNVGTYTGTYGSIVNPPVVSFTITSTGIISGPNSPASVYANTAHTLTNLGKVTNTGVVGVELKLGGTVINGSSPIPRPISMAIPTGSR